MSNSYTKGAGGGEDGEAKCRIWKEYTAICIKVACE